MPVLPAFFVASEMALFFDFLFYLILCIPSILATHGELASLNPALFQRDTTGTDDCIIVPRQPGSRCDVCYSEGGRCLLDRHDRCVQYLAVPGRHWPKPVRFSVNGPGSCLQCRCAKAVAAPGPPKLAAPKPAVRVPEEVVETRKDGTGFEECALRSSHECGATECFAAGGRCKLSSSGSCYPHVLNSAGRLILHRWGSRGTLPICKGCHCERVAPKHNIVNPGFGIAPSWPPATGEWWGSSHHLENPEDRAPDIVYDTPSSSPPVSERGRRGLPQDENPDIGIADAEI